MNTLKPAEFVRLRLLNQRLYGNPLEQAADVVAWMGAVQAQDYPAALWAVGQRARQAVDSDVERALAERAIVRTWPIRGTLHFVPAADARWITALCAPRILAGAAGRQLRDFDLDEAEFDRSREALTGALRGGKQLEREGMFQALNAAGVVTTGQRGYHILWRLAQEGLLCFGPRKGKPQTFVLFDEWIPNAKKMEREEALAELALRYFTSHGPATPNDFSWWSGLTFKDAVAGLEANRQNLQRAEIAGQIYWFPPPLAQEEIPPPHALLLPAYDEYTVAYKDRTTILGPAAAQREDSSSEILKPIIVMDGLVRGTWRRTLKKNTVSLAFGPFGRLSSAEEEALNAAAEKYGEHLSLAAQSDED
jgi:hypothetical protein